MMWHRTGWSPWREMERMRSEINRMYQNMPASFFFDTAFLPGRSSRTYPLLNVTETGDGYRVDALAPGLDPSKLDITVKGKALTITGAKAPIGDVKPENLHRNERAAGEFVRSLELPFEIASDKVEASYSDGLLSIALPKAEHAKPKQIEVKVG